MKRILDRINRIDRIRTFSSFPDEKQKGVILKLDMGTSLRATNKAASKSKRLSSSLKTAIEDGSVRKHGA
jgi:hypothetical protein